MKEISKVKKSRNIKCMLCNNISSEREWNLKTMGKCNTIEKRKCYTSISKLTDENKCSIFYLCPKCGNWVRGEAVMKQG